MANTFKFAQWVCEESLRQLLNRLVIAGNFNTSYNKEFTKEYAIGDTVTVKKPQRFVSSRQLAYSPQPINRKTTQIAVDRILHIGFEWDSIEKALNAERGDSAIRKEYIEPALSQIAQDLDSDAALYAYQNSPNIAGTLGTDPTKSDTLGDARQRLIEMACPAGGNMIAAVSPSVMNKIVNGNTATFNPQADVSKAFKAGFYGRLRDFDMFESMSLYSHTAGVWGGAVTVNGASQSGSQIKITATAADTFNVGDVVSFGTKAASNMVYAVNPSTRRSTGSAATFTVTKPLTAVGGGDAADILNIYPAIEGPTNADGSPNQYQNVSVLPATGAALTLFPGTTTPSGLVGTNGLALHNDAFAIVGVKLEVPKAVEMAYQARDPETGLSVRFVRAWDQIQSKMTNRFDVVYGFGNLYPENCSVRILGA